MAQSGHFEQARYMSAIGEHGPRGPTKRKFRIHRLTKKPPPRCGRARPRRRDRRRFHSARAEAHAALTNSRLAGPLSVPWVHLANESRVGKIAAGASGARCRI
jgi:hypothetical protein